MSSLEFHKEGESASLYDAVRYPSHVHAQTHPERLATIASLFGMSPVPATRCRVLELGCGDASNLLPMAWSLPESEFTGIDLAARPIAAGRRTAEELGLRNLHLHQHDIRKMDPSSGPFDYIIAHGVYSWVPHPVRQQLIELLQKCLAPQGVAFVSYNVLPGAQLLNMLRGMMLHHVRDLKTPADRLRQAFAFADFLNQGMAHADSAMGRWLHEELDRIRELEPGHVFHDHLAEINDACHFTDFMGDARCHGLQYVGEADLRDMNESIFPHAARQLLDRLEGDRIRREQYLDFLRVRRFRQSLLTHASIPVAHRPSARQIRRMMLQCSFESAGGPMDLRPGISHRFVGPKGQAVESDLPLGKASLTILQKRGPIAVPYDELLRSSAHQLEAASVHGEAGAPQQEAFDGFLLALALAGVVKLHSWQAEMPVAPSDRPVASPLARIQIRTSPTVTTLHHQLVKLEDEVGRTLVALLDGTRDVTALKRDLVAELEGKGILDAASPHTEKARREVETGLENNLRQLCRMGLLIA